MTNNMMPGKSGDAGMTISSFSLNDQNLLIVSLFLLSLILPLVIFLTKVFLEIGGFTLRKFWPPNFLHWPNPTRCCSPWRSTSILRTPWQNTPQNIIDGTLFE
jgi:hypothetical protein